MPLAPSGAPAIRRPRQPLLSTPPGTQVHPTSSLPSDTLGCTDGTTIWLTTEQTIAEARCTLVHELIHIERGHRGCQPPDVEASVEIEAAQRLISIDDLAHTLAQARTETEAAEMLWVDTATLRARLSSLTEAEREYITQPTTPTDGIAC